jgi:mRNA-degrading endonuclease RelE of RelBE toxin-antitoxin system
MFNVYLSRKALESLKNIRNKPLERIKNLLLRLKTNPVPAKEFDIRKIKNIPDTYRVRISRYRIIYRIMWDTNEVYVSKIAGRNEKTYRL